jgi:hypothetical protein
MKTGLSFLLLLLLFCQTACKEKKQGQKGDKQKQHTQVADSTQAYDLNNPTATFKLPAALREISGITPLDSIRIACVEDEHGIVYIYNLATGTIERQIPFAENGDYEDLAADGNTLYVMRTDGILFKLTDINTTKPVVTKIRTGIISAMDPEGLALDKQNQRLLIALKGISGILDEPEGTRAIYSFSLASDSFIKNPLFLVKRKQLQEKVGRGVEFQPSAIAIHPLSGQYYLVATAGKSLVITTPRGAITAVQSISQPHFVQPEGMFFAPNGDLYISNEGRDGKATILQFKYLSHAP